MTDRQTVGPPRAPRTRAASVGLIAAVVAIIASWRPSLWTDEAATISAARRSVSELFAMAGTIDAVHSAYYLFMHVWLLAFPADAFWLRLPSAVAVGLSTVVLYLMAHRLGGPRLALVSSIVFAVLPRTTWMGIEARSYAFSSLLAIAATAVLLAGVDRTVEEPRSGRRTAVWAAAYAGLIGLGVAVNLYVALMVGAHGVSLLLSRRLSWRTRFGWLAAGVVGIGLAGAVVWTVLHQTGQLGNGGLNPVSWVRGVVINQWFLGETPTLTTGASSGGGSAWRIASVGLALVGWSVVIAGLLLGRRAAGVAETETARVAEIETARVAAWAAPWIVVPTIVIGGYSLLIHDVYNARYLAFATGGLALLIGLGVERIAERLAGGRRAAGRFRAGRPLVALLVVGVLLIAPIYVSQRQVYGKNGTDWSRAAAFVAEHKGGASGVYFSPRFPIPAGATTVGPTARGIRVAYPEAFAGLADLTLIRTPVEDDNLVGTSRLLVDATSELAAVDHVWVIRRHDYAYGALDDGTLAAAGFTPGRRWRGPLDQVIEFDRAAR